MFAFVGQDREATCDTLQIKINEFLYSDVTDLLVNYYSEYEL